MNRDQVAGRWKEFRGKAKERWGKLSDDDISKAEGNLDQLEGKLQSAYGYSKEEAKKEVDDFCKTCSK